MDYDAVAKRRARCGYAAMVYKSAPTKEGEELNNKIDDDSIAEIYHRLNKIEECFRIMKKKSGLKTYVCVELRSYPRTHNDMCVGIVTTENVAEEIGG